MFDRDISINIKVVFNFQTYDQSELLQAKLEILSKTNMIDYVIDIRKLLYPDEPVPEVCYFFSLTILLFLFSVYFSVLCMLKIPFAVSYAAMKA